MTTTAVAASGSDGAAAVRRLRGPVPREDAARNVRLVAVAFGVTVVVTRLYLALTGYPQIGGAPTTSPTPSGAGCSCCSAASPP